MHRIVYLIFQINMFEKFGLIDTFQEVFQILYIGSLLHSKTRLLQGAQKNYLIAHLKQRDSFG